MSMGKKYPVATFLVTLFFGMFTIIFFVLEL